MSTEYIAHTETLDGLTLEIVPDQDPSNPRHEWDNAAAFVCWHSRYNLGDKEKRLSENGVPADLEGFKEWMATKEGKAAVIVPLYLYDHSGITIKAGSGFSCPWDSGRVGFAVVTQDRGRKEWGRVWRKKARACIMAETETYDDYLTGSVYGIRVKDAEGETVDSVWGCYGLAHAKEEGAIMLKAAATSAAELRRKNEMTLAGYAD